MAKMTKIAKMPKLKAPTSTNARAGSFARAGVVRPGEISGPSIDHVDKGAMAHPTNNAGGMRKPSNKCPGCGRSY